MDMSFCTYAGTYNRFLEVKFLGQSKYIFKKLLPNLYGGFYQKFMSAPLPAPSPILCYQTLILTGECGIS